MTHQYAIIATDWGYMGLLRSARGLRRTVLPLPAPEDVETALLSGIPDAEACPQLYGPLEGQIQDYFAGRHTVMDTGPELDLSWARPFTRTVLQACRSIPAGETRSYGQLAQTVGRPAAARAVGGALGRNPLPLVVPCHRVVGARGRLTGFTAPGGLDLKRRMLDLEAAGSA
jgi:methylated-DNA-[protein]-cysteine S-methyltransferase